MSWHWPCLTQFVSLLNPLHSPPKTTPSPTLPRLDIAGRFFDRVRRVSSVAIRRGGSGTLNYDISSGPYSPIKLSKGIFKSR